ncbi:MAG: hypothetical protein GY710_12195 [Desulfobacteraceae bacterium]|nr:hypothetical protein [Desulfobacteraceae bacterium]
MNLLPPNYSDLEQAVDQTASSRIEGIDVHTCHLWNPDLCPA